MGAIKRVGGSSIYRKSDTQLTVKMIRVLLLITLMLTLVSAVPKPMSDMEIYTQCKAQYGTSPTVECKSSQDCSLRSTKCPEHDCLRGREGRSFCTWQVYRK